MVFELTPDQTQRIIDLDRATEGQGPQVFALSDLANRERAAGLRRGVPGMAQFPFGGDDEDDVPNVGGPGTALDIIAEGIFDFFNRDDGSAVPLPDIEAPILPTGKPGLDPFPFANVFTDPGRVVGGILNSLRFSLGIDQPIQQGGSMTMQQAPAFPSTGGIRPRPGGTVSTGTIVKVWDTAPGRGVTGGGAFPIFAELVDGRIAVFVDGRLRKIFRRKKPIVISRDPRLSDVRKIDRLHKRIQKTVKRVLPPSRRK